MRYTILASLLFCACGTIAEGDGGDSNLPSRGIIPFEKLAPVVDDEDSTLPFVLSSLTAHLDEPFLLDDGRHLVVWLQASIDDHMWIQRAESNNGRDFNTLRTVFEAENAWEEQVVGSPNVVAFGGTYLMFYLGGNGTPAVGLARSDDGINWQREPEPVFEPSAVIASPAVVVWNGVYHMYYARLEPDEDGVLESVAVDHVTSRDGLDWGEPENTLSTGTGCIGDSGAEVRCWDAVTVGSPGARVSTTPTGRQVLDLWYSGGLGSNTNIGFAGSFDGEHFSRYALNPVLADGGPESGAHVMFYEGRLRMYYSDEYGQDLPNRVWKI